MTCRHGRSGPRRERPARRLDLEVPTGEDAGAPGRQQARLDEARQSCREQTLKGPHAPPGVAFDMRSTDTEQREAGRSDGAGSRPRSRRGGVRRCYAYTQTADKHRSRQQECQ